MILTKLSSTFVKMNLIADDIPLQQGRDNVEQIKKPILKNIGKDSELTLRQQLSVVDRGDSSIMLLPSFLPQHHNLLEEDKKNMMKNWISLRFDLVDEFLLGKMNLTSNQHSDAWSDLLQVAISAYPSCDVFSRQHLRVVVEETALYILNHHSFTLSIARHAELVGFLAPLSPERALLFLKLLSIERWTDPCHAIAYQLEWQSTASSAIMNDVRIILEATPFAPQDIDTDSKERDTFEFFDWNQAPPVTSSAVNSTISRHFEECAPPSKNENLGKDLRNSHWNSLREKFESVWSSQIEGSGLQMTQLPEQTIHFAFSIIEAITALSIHFEQFEYCWYWSEKSKLPIKWAVLQNVITCCRLAASSCSTEDMQVWKARGWTLYKKVYEIPKHKIHGKAPYISFMTEFVKFIRATESNDQHLVVIPRIITDMIEHCSVTYFPVIEEIVFPLIDICWNFRHEPREKWEASFRKVFEIYVLHKFYKSRRGSTFAKSNYFSPENLVRILAICTVAGFVDEFKILNRDILLAITEKQSEYVLAVQKGYVEFVKASRDGVVAMPDSSKLPAEEVVEVPRQILFDPVSLSNMSDLLLGFMNKS